MAAPSAFVIVALFACNVVTVISAMKSDPLLRVTDDNWRQVLKGEWMVEFMAPWCPACRSFQTTWESLAEWSRDLDINVGVVDVTENPGLSGRFLVTSLPTIYHIKDGEFRVYKGARKENDLLSFVDDKKWQEVDPVSSWTHPSSFQMGIVGFFFKFAMVIRAFYSTMTTEYGIPEWGCYLIFAIATIVAGLFLGLIFVLCCDWLFPAKYTPAQVIPPQESKPTEREEDDESDILDDTEQSEPVPPAGEGGDNAAVRRRQRPASGSPSSEGESTASSS